MSRIASLIVPAHDEAALIGRCLGAVLASDCLPEGWALQVIVVANGCSDDTADRARASTPDFGNRGWDLKVLELEQGGKLGALNAGDGAATGQVLLYLDADVTVGAAVLPQIIAALDDGRAGYASGRANVTTGAGRFSRAYTRFWLSLPFHSAEAPGFGLFAMTRAGRARWQDWPDIISDDTYARLHFRPSERTTVKGSYDWPMIEGFANLVRVRRRQNAGVAQIATRYPELLSNDDKARPGTPGLAGRAARDPLGFLAYVLVSLAVRLPVLRSTSDWARGR